MLRVAAFAFYRRPSDIKMQPLKQAPLLGGSAAKVQGLWILHKVPDGC